MRKGLTLIFFTLITKLISAQDIKKNNIFFELGGNGLAFSINYERQITKHPGLGMRIGVGSYGFTPAILTIPVGMNYLFKTGNKKSFVDLGLGVTWTKADVLMYINVKPNDLSYVNTNHINIVPSLGYRRQNNNIMWRISLSPVINHYGFIPFVGFSIGKVFGK